MIFFLSLSFRYVSVFSVNKAAKFLTYAKTVTSTFALFQLNVLNNMNCFWYHRYLYTLQKVNCVNLVNKITRCHALNFFKVHLSLHLLFRLFTNMLLELPSKARVDNIII